MKDNNSAILVRYIWNVTLHFKFKCVYMSIKKYYVWKEKSPIIYLQYVSLGEILFFKYQNLFLTKK